MSWIAHQNNILSRSMEWAENALDSNQKRITQIESDIREKRHSTKEIQRRILETRTDLEKNKQNSERKRESLTILRDLVHAQMNNLSLARADLDWFRKEEHVIANRIIQLESELSSWWWNLLTTKDTKKANKQIMEQIAAERLKYEEIERKIAEYDANILILQQEYEDTQHRMQNIKDEIADLAQENIEMTEHISALEKQERSLRAQEWDLTQQLEHIVTWGGVTEKEKETETPLIASEPLNTNVPRPETPDMTVSIKSSAWESVVWEIENESENNIISQNEDEEMDVRSKELLQWIETHENELQQYAEWLEHAHSITSTAQEQLEESQKQLVSDVEAFQSLLHGLPRRTQNNIYKKIPGLRDLVSEKVWDHWTNNIKGRQLLRVMEDAHNVRMQLDDARNAFNAVLIEDIQSHANTSLEVQGRLILMYAQHKKWRTASWDMSDRVSEEAQIPQYNPSDIWSDQDFLRYLYENPDQLATLLPEDVLGKGLTKQQTAELLSGAQKVFQSWVSHEEAVRTYASTRFAEYHLEQKIQTTERSLAHTQREYEDRQTVLAVQDEIRGIQYESQSETVIEQFRRRLNNGETLVDPQNTLSGTGKKLRITYRKRGRRLRMSISGRSFPLGSIAGYHGSPRKQMRARARAIRQIASMPFGHMIIRGGDASMRMIEAVYVKKYPNETIGARPEHMEAVFFQFLHESTGLPEFQTWGDPGKARRIRNQFSTDLGEQKRIIRLLRERRIVSYGGALTPWTLNSAHEFTENSRKKNR